MEYQKAMESAGAKLALDRLKNRFSLTREVALKVWAQAREMVITDCDIVVDDMLFEPQNKVGSTPLYFVKVDGVQRQWTVHPHALKQMSNEVSIPTTFVNTLTYAIGAWERRELTDLLNERFRKCEFKQRSFLSRASFTNRVVGTEVRGFVSPSFKIWLSTPHMLEAFARACQTYGAMPVEAKGTSLHFNFRSMLPHVFEPKAGTFIALGASFTNSDFGAGALRIKLDVMNVANGTISSVKPVMSKSHGGGARKDQEEHSSVIKPDTMRKLVEASKAEVKDAVESALHPDAVNGLLETVTKAMEAEISWARLQNYLSGKLTQEEIRQIEQLIKGERQSKTLPSLKYDNDGSAVIDLWWASNAVAEIADTVTDGDRQADLRDAAGGLLLR